MELAIRLLFVIFGGGYYWIKYLLESGEIEANKRIMEKEKEEEFKKNAPIREKRELEHKYYNALRDYLENIVNEDNL